MHFIKLILEYLRSMKSDNLILNILATIAIVIIGCCQALWDMLSTNAYYLVAMFGVPFCAAMSLGMELVGLVVALFFQIVGNVMVNVGVLLVTLSASYVTLWIVDYDFDDEHKWVPIVCVLLVGVMISSLVLSVYSVIMRTGEYHGELMKTCFIFQTITRALYVCVCVDMRQSPNDPFSDNPVIRDYIQKANTKITKSENVV